MNEFLMQLLKELEKNLHRSNVRSVGMGISQQTWAEKLTELFQRQEKKLKQFR